MNITLSVDAQIVKRAREFAMRRGATLNGLVREYLDRISESKRPGSPGEEFAQIAMRKAGLSPRGYRFDPDQANRRR